MTLAEWTVEFELRMPSVSGGYAGKLTHGDVLELKDWLDGAS